MMRESHPWCHSYVTELNTLLMCSVAWTEKTKSMRAWRFANTRFYSGCPSESTLRYICNVWFPQVEHKLGEKRDALEASRFWDMRQKQPNHLQNGVSQSEQCKYKWLHAMGSSHFAKGFIQSELFVQLQMAAILEAVCGLSMRQLWGVQLNVALTCLYTGVPGENIPLPRLCLGLELSNLFDIPGRFWASLVYNQWYYLDYLISQVYSEQRYVLIC